MYVLPIERQSQILSSLVEGMSVRSVSRMSGAHQVTILSLLRRVGDGCDRLMDKMMHGLACHRLELDEIWAYVGMKQKRAGQYPERRAEIGDFYTFVALDSETKLVPCYRVGKRTWSECETFVNDLRSRLTVRPQITTDAFGGYYESIWRAFDTQVDYAQLTKVFASELNTGRGRYSPPVLVESARETLIGNPDERFISTSFVERQNLTMRMCMRRFTRLTNGFSRKLENLKAAVALHFAWYNLIRTHMTLRCTPAMEAGVSNRLWTMSELIEAALAN